MIRQRQRTEHETKIYRALVKALAQKGLKYRTVAQLIGIKYQTARESISSGKFSEAKATQWSALLDIPIEVFLEGAELPENNLHSELVALQKKVDQIQSEVNELKRWKNHVTGADDIDKNP